jgi:hypothetical protein
LGNDRSGAGRAIGLELTRLYLIILGISRWAASMRTLAVKLLIVALLLASMTSCSDGQQQTERQIRSVLSWSATADMALDARVRMLVPNSFTALTMERCGKEIGSLSTKLSASRRDFATVADQLNTVIGAAHDDLVNGRTDTISQHLEALRNLEAKLKTGSGAAQ